MNGSFSQAENRVREMNNITRGYLERSNRSFGHLPPEPTSAAVSAPRFEPVQINTQVQPAPCPEPSHIPCPNPAKDSPCPPSDPLGKLFSGADGEKTLILLLILVLINERADIKLIFALIYLIL
ncbi:MAG: hypothetical protein IJZ72_00170 [Oscillospiraceae bacterium]|nr:hypothetical protein [Oscillospiraceae bacterium]